jgi:hypothetical protein
MRFLPLEDRISILHFPGGVYHFNRLAPEAFIQKFNIYSVKKLKEYNLNDQFISKVFELLGNDLLSFIINFSAYSHKWATVKFMLVKGVSPLLLVYSVRRAATHQLTEDLGKLRYLLNSTNCAFDFERFSVSKPDITHLKRFLAEHKLGFNYHISAFDSRRIDLMLEDACANGQVELVRALIDLGADIHRIDDQALRRAAARENRHDLIDILLRAGANIYARNGEAFATAASGLNKNSCKVLIKYGGDLFSYKKRYISSFLQMMDLMGLDSSRLTGNPKYKR